MITIEIDGKKYIARRSKWSVRARLENWIQQGFLELQPQEEKTDVQRIAESVAKEFGGEHTKNNTINLLSKYLQLIILKRNRYHQNGRDVKV